MSVRPPLSLYNQRWSPSQKMKIGVDTHRSALIYDFSADNKENIQPVLPGERQTEPEAPNWSLSPCVIQPRAPSFSVCSDSSSDLSEVCFTGPNANSSFPSLFTMDQSRGIDSIDSGTIGTPANSNAPTITRPSSVLTFSTVSNSSTFDHSVSHALDDRITIKGSSYQREAWEYEDGSKTRREVWRPASNSVVSTLSCGLISPGGSPTRSDFRSRSPSPEKERRGRALSPSHRAARGQSPSPISRATSPLRSFASFNCFTPHQGTHFDELVERLGATGQEGITVPRLEVLMERTVVSDAEGPVVLDAEVPFVGTPASLQHMQLIMGGLGKKNKRTSVISVGSRGRVGSF